MPDGHMICKDLPYVRHFFRNEVVNFIGMQWPCISSLGNTGASISFPSSH